MTTKQKKVAGAIRVEINVLERDMWKEEGGGLMVGGRLWGDAGMASESTCAAAHSIKH